MTWTLTVSHAWLRLHVITSNSDWFIALFARVRIGQSNWFGFDFTTLNGKSDNLNLRGFVLTLFSGVFSCVLQLLGRKSRGFGESLSVVHPEIQLNEGGIPLTNGTK